MATAFTLSDLPRAASGEHPGIEIYLAAEQTGAAAARG